MKSVEWLIYRQSSLGALAVYIGGTAWDAYGHRRTVADGLKRAPAAGFNEELLAQS